MMRNSQRAVQPGPMHWYFGWLPVCSDNQITHCLRIMSPVFSREFRTPQHNVVGSILISTGSFECRPIFLGNERPWPDTLGPSFSAAHHQAKRIQQAGLRPVPLTHPFQNISSPEIQSRTLNQPQWRIPPRCLFQDQTLVFLDFIRPGVAVQPASSSKSPRQPK